MFEILIELLGELMLQVVLEVLAEFGLHSIAEPFRKKPNPWLATGGYALFGTVVGGLSVWMFPSGFVKMQELRLINLGFTPIVAGLMMCAIGMWRAQRGQALLRIDRFSYGYLFAFSLALVRFWFTS